MNYKNWDNRKINKGRGRNNNWNWRGRGYNRMANPFLQNLSWVNPSQNYQYHLTHHEATTHYQHSKFPRPPVIPSNITSVIVSKPESPLPGSEEYTQNKIQQTSDLIKRQLNIDSETCSASDFSSSLMLNDSSNNNLEEEQENNADLESSTRPSENKRIVKPLTRKNKIPDIIDVQEIHDQIIKHISNLSYSKKMNLVNQSTVGYDIAIQEIQKQKQLELSRALRDMSKRQSQSSDDGEVINAIIPDIGIKIEDLPNDIIAELSNSLNLHLEDQVPNLVDPEVCFKQAEEILNVNYEGDDSNLKMLQHNLRINECINNQIGNSNQIHSDVPVSNITTTNYNLLNKSEEEYHLDSNTFEDHSENFESYVPKQNAENMFFDRNNTHNNEDNDEDDYSKDVEFNNFCFENLDVTKSYLVPFTSIKSDSENFVNDTSADSIPEKLPKISIRKDIMLDTISGNNRNVNVEMFKSQSTNQSHVDISHSVESQIKFTADNNESFTSIIESTNYLSTLQEHSLNKFIHKDSIIHNKDAEYDSNWKENTNGNKTHPEVDTDLPISAEILNNSNASINENYSNEEHGLNCKNDLKRSKPPQTTDIIALPIQELQNVDKTLQTLENSSQKRWKSPGEKKMMTDIHPKSNIITNLEQTLNNTILEQMEEFNKKMMTISTKSCIERKESENSIIIDSKNTNNRLSQDFFHSKDLLKNSPVLTSESYNKIDQNDTALNIAEQSEDALPVFSKSIVQDSLIREMDHVIDDNIQSLQEDDKNSVSYSDYTSTSFPIVEPADNLNLDNKDTSYDISQEMIQNAKDNSNTDKQIIKFDGDQKLRHNNLEQKEKAPRSKNNTVKEHKYKKAKSPKCKNNHKTNDKYSPSKQKIAKTDVIASSMLNDINKNALNMKINTNKIDKQNFDKTEKNEVCRKIKTAAEKKETVPILKCVQNVYVQTDFDLKTVNFKLQLKECKNAQIQTSNFLISSSVQTSSDLETYDSELKHRNYLNSLFKLKQIDEEIERLMSIKKNLYESIEHEYSKLNPANLRDVHNSMGDKNLEKQFDVEETCTEKNKEKCVQREFTTMVVRKHKKTDSSNEHEECVQSPKRKKRHRNFEKNTANSNINSQLNIANNTNNQKPLNSEENQCTNMRKPLSIKISLKNITQSSPRSEFVNTSDKGVIQKTSTKSLEDSSISNNNKSTNKNNISIEKQSRKRNSAERKLEMDNRESTKEDSVSKVSGRSEVRSNNINLPHKGRNHIRAGKNKKLKVNKQDKYDSKLCENNQERIFSKSCHVVIERFTIGYLENLKKSLRETKNESQGSYLIDEKKEDDIDSFASSNSAFATVDACDLKETVIEDTHMNSNQNEIYFKNFMGSVLHMQLVQDELLAGTDCGYLYFFNVNTGDSISSISVSDKPLTSIYTLLNDEHYYVYTGCLKGNLTLIDFDSKQVLNTVQCEEGIQCLEKGWEYLFMGSNSGHVMRYNFKKTKLESSIKIYDSNILAIKATQEGARRVILVASRNAQITVRDAMSGLLLRTMDSSFYPTVYAILLENNLVYCGTSQHNVLIYTFQDGQLSHKYEAVNSKGIVCLKATGNLLFAGCYSGNIYVYNTNSNKYLGQISGPGGMLLSMDVYGNKIIVGTKSNKLRSLMIPQLYLDQLSS